LIFEAQRGSRHVDHAAIVVESAAVRYPDSFTSIVLSIAAIVLLPVTLLVICSAALVMVFFRASQRRLNGCYTGFARACLMVARTRLSVHGTDQFDAGRPYVVVANHESNWDPVCIVAALRMLLIRFVAKREIMKIPILGQALRATGNVTVFRQRDPGDVRRIRSTMEARDPEVSMLFFAEGTRSRKGSFESFKMGAFATAIQNELPILPVAVAGTRRIWAPDTIWFRRGEAMVEVGVPIETQGLRREDRRALRDQTREAVADLRQRGVERLRATGVEPGGIE